MLYHFQLWKDSFLYENILVKHWERKLGGLEESIGMLAALSDMVNDAKISSESITFNEALKKENHERFPLMYNLCVIKIGLEILRLKLNKIDGITNEQFFKIDTAISEMSDEILELRERQELLVN